MKFIFAIASLFYSNISFAEAPKNTILSPHEVAISALGNNPENTEWNFNGKLNWDGKEINAEPVLPYLAFGNFKYLPDKNTYINLASSVFPAKWDIIEMFKNKPKAKDAIDFKKYLSDFKNSICEKGVAKVKFSQTISYHRNKVAVGTPIESANKIHGDILENIRDYLVSGKFLTEISPSDLVTGRTWRYQSGNTNFFGTRAGFNNEGLFIYGYPEEAVSAPDKYFNSDQFRNADNFVLIYSVSEKDKDNVHLTWEVRPWLETPDLLIKREQEVTSKERNGRRRLINVYDDQIEFRKKDSTTQDATSSKFIDHVQRTVKRQGGVPFLHKMVLNKNAYFGSSDKKFFPLISSGFDSTDELFTYFVLMIPKATQDSFLKQKVSPGLGHLDFIDIYKKQTNGIEGSSEISTDLAMNHRGLIWDQVIKSTMSLTEAADPKDPDRTLFELDLAKTLDLFCKHARPVTDFIVTE